MPRPMPRQSRSSQHDPEAVHMVDITGWDQRDPHQHFRPNPSGLSPDEFHMRSNPEPSYASEARHVVKAKIARLRTSIESATGEQRLRLLNEFAEFADTLSDERLKQEIHDFCVKAARITARSNPHHGHHGHHGHHEHHALDERERVRQFYEEIADPRCSVAHRRVLIKELREFCGTISDSWLQREVHEFCEEMA